MTESTFDSELEKMSHTNEDANFKWNTHDTIQSAKQKALKECIEEIDKIIRKYDCYFDKPCELNKKVKNEERPCVNCKKYFKVKGVIQKHFGEAKK